MDLGCSPVVTGLKLCLWLVTHVSLCVSVLLQCAGPVFHPTVLRGTVGCLLYRLGSKSVSVLFEALLLASTSTPVSLLSQSHPHQQSTSAASGLSASLFYLFLCKRDRVRDLVPSQL